MVKNIELNMTKEIEARNLAIGPKTGYKSLRRAYFKCH